MMGRAEELTGEMGRTSREETDLIERRGVSHRECGWCSKIDAEKKPNTAW